MPAGDTCPFRPFLRLSPNGTCLTVSVNGGVHLCLFLLAPPLGDAVREPVVGMLRRARRDPYFRSLDRGTIPEFAEDRAGIPLEESRRRIAEQDLCTFCVGVQRDLLAEGPDRPLLHDVIERERPSGSRGMSGSRFTERAAGHATSHGWASVRYNRVGAPSVRET